MNDPRWASIDAFAEENRDNILRDITRLVAVPSVEGEAAPGAPFGPGPKAALAKALEIAEELGLSTCNADSYIGWAETGTIADDQKFLATITHTDVVPEGNGWDADPYTVRVRDGWLLGRGVADDKGPSILCLYALKYLKDSGVQLKYPVRALLGANEETNMHDVDYYAEHYPMPAFCFTPDAEFPVCNGEKGGFNGEIVSPKLDGIITAFEGGVAHNAVPDRASCTVQVAAGALVQTEGVTFEAGEGGSTIIRGWGKSGHAAMPEGTVNAISLIVDCLLKSGVCTPQEDAYLQVLHTLHASTDGSALGIAAERRPVRPADHYRRHDRDEGRRYPPELRLPLSHQYRPREDDRHHDPGLRRRCPPGGPVQPGAVLHRSRQPGYPDADHHLQRCDR